jgi:hypothetical protein
MVQGVHDCFGVVVVVKDGVVIFLCDECGRETARIEAGGLELLNKHGADKHRNVIPLRALKVAIAQVEKKGPTGPGS